MALTLEKRFLEPEPWTWGEFTNAAGAVLRYGHIDIDKPRGTAVVCGGLTEFTEKYFEVIRDLMARGFSVWAMDWRGQGLSERYPEPRSSTIAHKRDFEDDVRDLHQFATEVVKPVKNAPLVYFGHSMGGHIGLRCVHDYPEVFSYAVLTAPMLDVYTAGFPRSFARFLSRSLPAQQPIFLARDWRTPPLPIAHDPFTHDPVRRTVHPAWTHHNPRLLVIQPSYGWLRAAFRSMDVTADKGWLKAVKTPMLIAIPSADKITIPKAALRASRLIPKAEHVDIPGARHEVWMEKDEYRSVFISGLDRFLNTRVFRTKEARRTVHK